MVMYPNNDCCTLPFIYTEEGLEKHCNLDDIKRNINWFLNVQWINNHVLLYFCDILILLFPLFSIIFAYLL